MTPKALRRAVKDAASFGYGDSGRAGEATVSDPLLDRQGYGANDGAALDARPVRDASVDCSPGRAGGRC